MKALITWFAGHTVAANMLMWMILIGGFVTALSIEQEVFPEVDSELVVVSVEFLGGSPDEVEEGICIKIEEAVAGLDDVKRVTSRAVGNLGTVNIEIETGADIRDVLDDVKSAVDAIDSFPDNAESPVIRELEIARQVLDVAIAGDTDEATLRRLAERVRDELLALPGISRVTLANARPYEISIEVPEQQLRRYGLTLDEVTAAVRASSLDLSGGSVKTEGGEILLRTKAQAYRQTDFEQIVLRTRDDGSRLYLGDVAEVVDAFADTGQAAQFDGHGAVMVKVWAVGDQRALDVADTVYAYVAASAERMPAGTSVTVWQDSARMLRSRLDLLVRNGRMGLILVFLMLALFLKLSLAFWVTLGIPISFLGTLWLMPSLGVSLNMISLFGFLVALGIVVDDAIVVGENIYRHHERGKNGLDAVLAGTLAVRAPVIVAVLTTVAAFSPLIGIPGVMGKFMEQLPLVVVPTLAFSLIESLLILPAHLSHLRPPGARVRKGLVAAWERLQGRFGRGLDFVVERLYKPSLAVALEWRYATLATAMAVLLVTGSLFASGRISFVFFPQVEADNVVAWLTMPEGTPDTVTAREARRIEAGLKQLEAEYDPDGGDRLLRHVLASVGEQPFRTQQASGFGNSAYFDGSHLAEINVELAPSEDRGVSSIVLQKRWRAIVGDVPGAVELIFSSNLMAAGEAINIEVRGPRVDDLRAIAAQLKDHLRGYPGVFDISDSFRGGRQELRLDITPEAESLGIDRAALARQVRQGFYGDEAQRIQRGRDEVKVMVRYPEGERRSLGDVEDMRIRLAGGVEVPFGQVAVATMGRGDAVIQRSDRQRSINVTADVDISLNDPNSILADVQATILPALLADHPGTSYSLEGEQREQAETMGGLARGFAIAMFLIYALVAIPFRSYVQPLIVMSAIPYGIVGAIWGHVLLGMNVTIMSMFGVVALTGVLVNDSLVMVHFVNRVRRDGATMLEAVKTAGPARFRAILLTSLTTFAGLTPLLLEQSMQAKFLIPMAVSLGFGVLFATFITLVLVPAGTLVVDDLYKFVARRSQPRADPAGSTTPTVV